MNITRRRMNTIQQHQSRERRELPGPPVSPCSVSLAVLWVYVRGIYWQLPYPNNTFLFDPKDRFWILPRDRKCKRLDRILSPSLQTISVRLPASFLREFRSLEDARQRFLWL